MSSTQAHYRESLQQSVDAEIKAIEESIKLLEVLKLRRNALQPISSLPPEIFAAIFSSLCLPGIPSLGGKPYRNVARLRISHVCHQWREIALNQPLLWSHINFDTVSLAGATEILTRAKSVPLYLEAMVSGRHDDHRLGQFLSQVQAYLPRIRHLSMSTNSDFISTIYGGLANTLVSPALTLEYLSLSFGENRRMEDQHPSISASQVCHTLFGGSTPRLSRLKLRNCNISWNSLLFKGLKHLEIITPYEVGRPTLAVWLDSLGEIPQLRTLTLHSASPVASHFPFDVERTVTLPSLTHLDISASSQDCALASAHLVLPALSSLCIAATDFPINGSGVQAIFPYIARHIHGPQDVRPLQSALLRNHVGRPGSYIGLLAWPVPDFDTVVHDPPAFLGATLPTRVKLSFTSNWEATLDVFEIMVAALPLDGLLTLAAVHVSLDYRLPVQQFWLNVLPNWPLLRRVQLARDALPGFIEALLEDRKDPLLPSLTELDLAEIILDAHQSFYLRKALMKRVEQGVPLKTLDLRMCSRDPYNSVAVQLLSEIAVDILLPLDFLGREDTEESRKAGYLLFAKMLTMWEPFLPYPYYSGEDDSEDGESEDEDDEDDKVDSDEEDDSDDEHDEDGEHGLHRNDGGYDDGDEHDNLSNDEDDEHDDDYVPDDD